MASEGSSPIFGHTLSAASDLGYFSRDVDPHRLDQALIELIDVLAPDLYSEVRRQLDALDEWFERDRQEQAALFASHRDSVHAILDYRIKMSLGEQGVGYISNREFLSPSDEELLPNLEQGQRAL